MARVLPHAFRVAVGRGRVLGADRHLPARAARGRRGRPPPEAPHARGDAVVVRPAGARARVARPRPRRRRLAHPRPQRVPGHAQRARHADAAGVRGRDDRGPRRPPQRDRAELLDVQRCAARRPGGGRRAHRRRGRRRLLPHQRRQLPRGDRRAARHAVTAAARQRPSSPRSPRAPRRPRVHVRLSTAPMDHPPALRRQLRGDAVRDADADLRLAGAPRRRPHARVSLRRDRRGRPRRRVPPRLAAQRGRARAVDPDRRRRVRGGVDRILLLAIAPRFPGAPGGRRVHDDHAHGGQQHAAPDHRGRRAPRPGDELLRHGVRRDGAFRQPGGRRARPHHRRAAHRDGSGG